MTRANTITDEDDGQQLVELRLEYQWRRVQHGDITAIYTWNWADEAGAAPCLVLGPTYFPPGRTGTIPMVPIDQRDLWRWSRDHNDDRVSLAVDGKRFNVSGDQWQGECAGHIARKLGLTDNPPTRNRIRGIIEDAIDDVLAMPPAPDLEPAENPAATFEILDLTTGETLHHSVTRH